MGLPAIIRQAKPGAIIRAPFISRVTSSFNALERKTSNLVDAQKTSDMLDLGLSLGAAPVATGVKMLNDAMPTGLSYQGKTIYASDFGAIGLIGLSMVPGMPRVAAIAMRRTAPIVIAASQMQRLCAADVTSDTTSTT